MTETDQVGTTSRAVKVLNALVMAGPEGVGVRELASELGLSRSAAHRILSALADLGMARLSDAGRYEVAAKTTASAFAIAERSPLLRSARPLLSELAKSSGECASLYVRSHEPLKGFFALSELGPNHVQFRIQVGRGTSLAYGAAGRAVLLHSDAALQDAVISEVAINDPDHAEALRRDLALDPVPESVVSRGESISEVAGVAAPFRAHGAVRGAVVLTMPSYRATDDGIESGRFAVLGAAARLSQALAPAEQLGAQ